MDIKCDFWLPIKNGFKFTYLDNDGNLPFSCKNASFIQGIWSAVDVLNCIPDFQWHAFVIEEEMSGSTSSSNSSPKVSMSLPGTNLNTYGPCQSMQNLEKFLDKEIVRIVSNSGKFIGGLDVHFCMKLVGRHLENNENNEQIKNEKMGQGETRSFDDDDESKSSKVEADEDDDRWSLLCKIMELDQQPSSTLLKTGSGSKTKVLEAE